MRVAGNPATKNKPVRTLRGNLFMEVDFDARLAPSSAELGGELTFAPTLGVGLRQAGTVRFQPALLGLLHHTPELVFAPTLAGNLSSGVSKWGGFGYSRTFELAPWGGTAETITDLVLPVRITGNWLKAAPTGRIQSGGLDVRFELADGTELGFDPWSYVASTGTLLGFLRIPSWNTGTALPWFMRYGKAGLTSPAYTPSLAWAGSMFARRVVDGVDRSSAGRHMTPSGITATTLLGMPAGAFAPASYLARSDVTHWNGRSAWTSMLVGMLRAMTQAAFYRLGGTVAGTAYHTLWVDLDKDNTGATNENRLTGGYKLQTPAGLSANPQAFGPVGSAVLNVPLVLSMAVSSGADPLVMKNEEVLASIVTGGIATGALVLDATAAERLGANPGATGNAITGDMLLSLAYPRRLTQRHLEVFARGMLDPLAVYGIGPENAAADADEGPLALPVRATGAAGVDITIDVLAKADPRGNVGLGLAIGTPPAAGTARVASGRAIYNGPAGEQTFDADVSATATGKLSRGRVSVSVTGSPPPPTGEYPDADLTFTVGYDGPGTRKANLREAYDAIGANPGCVHIILGPGADHGPIDFDRNITGVRRAKPIVVRARDLPTLTAGSGGYCTPRTFMKEVNVKSQAKGIQIHGFGMRSASGLIEGPEFTMTRCLLASSGNSGTFYKVFGTDAWFGMVEIGPNNGIGIAFSPSSGARRPKLTQIIIHDHTSLAGDDGNGNEGFRLGQGREDHNISLAGLCTWIYAKNMHLPSDNETCSCKSADNEWRYVILENTRFLNVRHSKGNKFFAILIKSGNKSALGLRDDNGYVGGIECRSGVLGLQVQTGDCDPVQFEARDGNYPRSADAIIVRPKCANGTLTIGSGGDSIKALRTIIEQNLGPQGSPFPGAGNAPTLRPAPTGPYIDPIDFAMSECGVMATWKGWPTSALNP